VAPSRTCRLSPFQYCERESERARERVRERVRESERERGRESDAVTNTSVAIMLVLAGSRSTVTEITGYKYFSLQKPSRASPNNSESNIAPLDLIIGLISFCVKHNMYILLHACSATVRFLHFWAGNNFPRRNRLLLWGGFG